MTEAFFSPIFRDVAGETPYGHGDGGGEAA